MKHELIASATASGGSVIITDEQQQHHHHLHHHQHLQHPQQHHFESTDASGVAAPPPASLLLYGSGGSNSSNNSSSGGGGGSGCVGNVPLPLYPAPVGRRLNWTFREKTEGNGIARDTSNSTDKHRTLTLDLLPDDAHIVHSPPSSQSQSTPPHSVSQQHQQQQQQQQQHHHHVIVQRKPTTAGSSGGGGGSSAQTMNHVPTQRASTLPRNPATATAQLSTTSSGGGANHQHLLHRQQQQQHQYHTSSAAYMLGLYGWRKRCLFVLICALITLIVTNLALTLWILKVMEFSADGMGSLKVVAGGLQLSGQALVLDLLKASTIRSKHGQPISIESTKNFTVNTRDWDGRIENQLFLGHDRLDVLSHSMQMFDAHGTVVFAADKNEVRIGANVLRVDGEGGIVFRDSVQTPLVRAEPGRELRFESPTRTVHINAGQDVVVKSAAGSIDAACLNDIRLRSEAGSIRLDASSIVLPNLRTALPASTPGPSPASGTGPHKVYQLCACANGKLFLALSHSVCAGDEASVCR